MRPPTIFVLPQGLMDDDNSLIAERRAKLAAIRARGVAFPNDFKPRDRAARARAPARPPRERGARAATGRGLGRRADDAQAHHGQGELRHPAGRERPDPAVRHPRRARRGRLRALQASRPRRHRRRRGNAVQDQDRRALGPGLDPAPADQEPRPLPDKFHGIADAGAEVPAPLHRPDHRRRRPAPASWRAARRSRRSAASWSSTASWRSRRRCSIRFPAARTPSPSSPITTRSTSRCSCGSRRSST